MTNAKHDCLAYELAEQFLFGVKSPGVMPELISSYLNPPLQENRPPTLNEIYLRILGSAQNANMKAGVIGRSINGVKNLETVLFGFEPKLVVENFKGDWEFVFKEIQTKLKPRGKLRTGARSIWPKYCKSILSGALFLSQFNSADEFYAWLELFNSDDKTRAALPMLLANEIEGFGFALACDFLKELGFINFAKPDVHLKEIFAALNLCATNANDYQVYKAILRVAKHAGKTPYAADKIYWLIASGYFYNHPDIGNNGRIGSRK